MQNANILQALKTITRLHISSARKMSVYEIFKQGFRKTEIEFNLVNLRALVHIAKEPEGLEVIAAELANFSEQEVTDDIRGEAEIYVEVDGLFSIEVFSELRREWIVSKVISNPPIDFNGTPSSIEEWEQGILNGDWHHEVAKSLTEAEIEGEGMIANDSNFDEIYFHYNWDFAKGELVNNPMVCNCVEAIYLNQVKKSV